MNATASYRFTIVVPLYDERENLPRLEERITAATPAVYGDKYILAVRSIAE